jgi:hypothetical protein
VEVHGELLALCAAVDDIGKTAPEEQAGYALIGQSQRRPGNSQPVRAGRRRAVLGLGATSLTPTRPGGEPLRFLDLSTGAH